MCALAVTCAAALAGAVRLTPVKGATYTGTVHYQTIRIKVACDGKTAPVSLPQAPLHCAGPRRTRP
jgi:hypothetical protein